MGWSAQEAKLLRERLEKDMESIRGQVFFLLRNYPDARENDGVLICQWLQTFKGVSSFQGLLRLSIAHQFSFETVRRARQTIQAAGFFLPSDEVIIKKRRLETIWRAVQGGAKIEEEQTGASPDLKPDS
jgi:hypothetical protein